MEECPVDAGHNLLRAFGVVVYWLPLFGFTAARN